VYVYGAAPFFPVTSKGDIVEIGLTPALHVWLQAGTAYSINPVDVIVQFW
jgi:hypothetical protein